MRTSIAAVTLATALALTGCSVVPPATQVAGPTRAAAPTPAVAPGASVAAAPTSAEPAPVPSAEAEPLPTVEPEPVPSAVPEPSAEPEPEPPPSVEPVPTAGTAEAATPRPEATVTPSPAGPVDEPTAEPTTEEADDGLRQGDSGPEVLALQQRLAELGYWAGGADGSFGALTTQAVLALQKAAGISRDGVVGPVTEAALAAGTRPRSRDGGDGVEIDLERQLLLVVRQGQVVTALNTSTGVVGRHDTPRGQFEVERAIDGLREAPLGELWRPRYFHRGYAVHGSPNIPAYPASHGCARLSDAAMDMIWSEDLMPVGSSVTVY